MLLNSTIPNYLDRVSIFSGTLARLCQNIDVDVKDGVLSPSIRGNDDSRARLPTLALIESGSVPAGMYTTATGLKRGSNR